MSKLKWFLGLAAAVIAAVSGYLAAGCAIHEDGVLDITPMVRSEVSEIYILDIISPTDTAPILKALEDFYA